ncbi:hypothetical protein LZ575_05130 [Antarcticibacterium sp. 1MA-6-2]|uniref:GyrI-like domain-containing protein n=1 Tax=Antarcticibacterium sp. 1MA-6-2 TaxID=2908210 RepID=UPI001F3C4714|nr:GyrI-like domain-containing protein [Antarcticibacterium sp. 1MA-6-2]UJH92007.1 hypothetical protein LZ575_05130 [Antarcticibacterium sp. 1MA-6-2]
MVKTLTLWTLIVVLSFITAWYFLIKEYNYSISFKIDETPGEVYQQLLYYKYNFLEEAKYTQKTPFKQLVQQVSVNDRDLQLTWNFIRESDSSSQITARVNSIENNSFARLKSLFGQDDAKKIITEEVQQFQIALNEEKDLYEVKIEGITSSPAATCACIKFENDVKNKATDMMKNIKYLSAYIQKNELDMTARPRINVLHWDIKSNRIKFEFCFPIDPENAPEETRRIYLKNLPARKSLLAKYNGNYMYSHLAWVKLLSYAEKEKIPVLNEPLEIFNNNPEMGGDARLWETEIYLPLESL